MNYAYGIDFGTTNTTITAVDNNGEVTKIPLDNDSIDPAVMRTAIYVSPEMEYKFGRTAVDAYVKDVSEGKVAETKNVFTGNMIKITGDADWNGVLPDRIVPEIVEVEVGDGGRLLQSIKSVLSNKYFTEVKIFGKVFKIEELVSLYLKEIKGKADMYLGENVTKAVIGKPVEFVGGNNKIALRKLHIAAQMAGFKEISFEYEPVGASYEYGVNIDQSHVALMFDFGGGTLDITIMSFPEKEVLSTVGIPLGGDYLNSEIFIDKVSKHFGNGETYGEKGLHIPEHIYQSLRNWYSISSLKTQSFANSLEEFSYKNSNKERLNNLRTLIYKNLGFSLYEEIDRAKRSLSSKEKEEISFDAFEIKIDEYISKDEFEEIIGGELERINVLVNRSLKEASLCENGVDVVLTTGGSSLIPIVRSLLSDRFGEKKISNTDAFTSVSLGLARIARERYLNN